MATVAPPAFTVTYKSEIRTRLTATVQIRYNTDIMDAIALWDTGATTTCISTEVVKRLGLIPIGNRCVSTPSGTGIMNTYLVDIVLPNSVVVSDIEVCDSAIGNQGIDALIGMDIISKGDFAVSNFNGSTIFTFRTPSIKRTDYVEESKVQAIIGSHGKGIRKRRG